MNALPYLVAVWLLCVGLYGMVTSRNLIHMIVCLSVAQSSTFVMLLAIGYKHDAFAPIFYDIPRRSPAVDPVVQALALTDVVVGVTIVALLLALAVQVYKRYESLDPHECRSMRG